MKDGSEQVAYLFAGPFRYKKRTFVQSIVHRVSRFFSYPKEDLPVNLIAIIRIINYALKFFRVSQPDQGNDGLAQDHLQGLRDPYRATGIETSPVVDSRGGL